MLFFDVSTAVKLSMLGLLASFGAPVESGPDELQGQPTPQQADTQWV